MKALADLPKRTAISLAVLAGSIVLFAIAFFTLGAAQKQAHADQTRLTGQIAQIDKNVQQTSTDRQFVLDNKDKYEALMQGDRLIPHARRAAIRQLQTLAQQRSLSALSYGFNAAGDQSLANAKSQPSSGDFKVSVENVELKLGAALDSQIFEMVLDLAESFPGAAVVQSIELIRPPRVTDEMLKNVGKSSDPGIVTGTVKFAWRTAQAVDKDKDKAPEKKGK